MRCRFWRLVQLRSRALCSSSGRSSGDTSLIRIEHLQAHEQNSPGNDESSAKKKDRGDSNANCVQMVLPRIERPQSNDKTTTAVETNFKKAHMTQFSSSTASAADYSIEVDSLSVVECGSLFVDHVVNSVLYATLRNLPEQETK